MALVGDYDESKLSDKLASYHMISVKAVRDWNAFVDIPEHQLELDPSCGCGKT